MLFTFHFNDCGLMLAFLRDAKTSQTCTRIINQLWDAAGPDFFRKLFAIILTDNGTEFSDPDGIELFRPDPIHNSTKLLPRGITRIPANQVTLDPMLLGAKFKRHADKTIMEKYDVKKSDTDTTQK